MARRKHGKQTTATTVASAGEGSPKNSFSVKLWSWVIRRKQIDWATLSTSDLKRCLTTFDLTALGIGSTLGAGAYVLAGQEAGANSGPSVILSFLIAAIASVLAGVHTFERSALISLLYENRLNAQAENVFLPLTGLCYAEFGARVPRAGSAYVYSYVTIAEIIAFYIGWDLILEYMIGTASVASAWSGYLDSLTRGAISRALNSTVPMHTPGFAPYPDFIAFAVVILLTFVLAGGVRESTMANNVLTVVNLVCILFVIICGLFKADFHNWNLSQAEVDKYKTDGRNVGKGGFFPFGISGMLTSAGSCFFGFVGFDAIVTTAEEAKSPQKSIPLSIIISLAFIFCAYFGVSSVITLMTPYPLLNVPAPLPASFDESGWQFARYIISVGALCALTSSLFGAMFPMPRIVYAMGSDGLIFKLLARVNSRTKTPVLATFLIGICTGLFAMLFSLIDLINMMSIGTLMAYSLVAICVVILRYSSEEFPKQRPTENGGSTQCSPLHGLNVLSAVVDPPPVEERATRNAMAHGPFHWRYVVPVGRKAGSMYRRVLPTDQSSILVNTTLGIFTVCCYALSANVAFLHPKTDYAWILTGILIVIVLSCTAVIALQPTNPQKLAFRVPLAPYLPLLSIFINSYLMISLPGATWIRFVVWLVIGMCVYLGYGIRHSRAPLRGQEMLEPVDGGVRSVDGFVEACSGTHGGGANVNDGFEMRETLPPGAEGVEYFADRDYKKNSAM